MTLKILSKITPIAIGAAAGFAYWYFIGCTTGSCPLTSTWTVSTLYGAFVGAMWLVDIKKKPAKPEPESDSQQVS